jgi:hypothetical protein
MVYFQFSGCRVQGGAKHAANATQPHAHTRAPAYAPFRDKARAFACGPSAASRERGGLWQADVTRKSQFSCSCACSFQMPPVLHGRPSLQTIATAGRQRRAAALHGPAHSKGAAPRPLTSRSTAPLPWCVSPLASDLKQGSRCKSVRAYRVTTNFVFTNLLISQESNQLDRGPLPRTVFCRRVQSPPASFKLPPAQMEQAILPVFASFDSVRVGHGRRASGAGNFPMLHAQCAEISISSRNCSFPLGTVHFLAHCPWHAARKAHSLCA